MKKFLSFAFVILMGITLAVGCKDKETSLDDVNAFLNDSNTMNMNLANTVAIIPFNHINGPRNEWKFYALVNFQYKTRFYVKYQVTYLSCTCRTADVNYWQTAYIELSLPTSGNPEDAVLKAISFDKDAMDKADGTNDGHYVAGFWGDSSPIWDEATGSKIIATYEKTEVTDQSTVRVPNSQVSSDPNYYLVEDGGKYYYPSIREDFIPLLIGKTKAQIDEYNVVDDMYTAEAMDKQLFDSLTGASVSTNNILRILHAMFEYHANTWFTAA